MKQTTVLEREIHVITVGEMGPAGPEGPPGSGGGASSTVTKNCDEVISAYRAVVSNGADGILLAQNTNLAHRNNVIGITTQAGVLNDDIIVQKFGELTFAGWAWTPGLPIFVGANGQLTQTPPANPAVFSQIVAQALTATKIDILLRHIALIL